MAETPQEALCKSLGLPVETGAGDLVTAFDRALVDARKKVERAEGRIHRLRAEKACDHLMGFQDTVEVLRAREKVEPLLEKIRECLGREQFPSAEVFLETVLKLRDALEDENLQLEIDAIRAEVEKGLRQPPPEEPIPPAPTEEPMSDFSDKPIKKPIEKGSAGEKVVAPEVPDKGMDEESSGGTEAPPPIPMKVNPPSARETEIGDEETTVVWPKLPKKSEVPSCKGLTLEIGGRRLQVVSQTRTQFGRDGKACGIALRVDHPRGEKEALIAANKRISRKHFFIEPIPKGVAVVDGSMDEGNHRKASSAGTFFDGEALDVDRLVPGRSFRLVVGQNEPGEAVPTWEVEAVDVRMEVGYPAPLFEALEQWGDRIAAVTMKRRDLIEEDVLLLWTAFPLGRIAADLNDIWLLRLYDKGYVFFDAAQPRYEPLKPDWPRPGGMDLPVRLLSFGDLTFHDPTVALK